MTFFTVIKKLLKNPAGAIGLILLLAFVAVAILAPVIAPPPENTPDPQIMPKLDYSREPQPPSEEHPFGTTVTSTVQYDIFYGVVWGTRAAFRLGIVITLFTTIIGIIIGSISAYYGGWVDEVLMRITEIFQAFPFLFATIFFTSIIQSIYQVGEGVFISVSKLFSLILYGHSYVEALSPFQMKYISGMYAIILFGWMTVARVIRGNILKIKNYEYAQAARTIGAKNIGILSRHLLPNAILPVLAIASINVGTYVLTFAGLSFLGVISREGYAEWGQMISDSRHWIISIKHFPHIIVYPSLALVLFALAWNLFGDSLQEILDPRMKGAR